MRLTAIMLGVLCLAPAAWAEDYVDVAVGSSSLSDGYRGQDFGGWNMFLGGRYDLPPRMPPFFLTADLFVHRLSSDQGTSTRDGLGHFDVGGGYAIQPNYCTELYARAEYYHYQQRSASAINTYDTTGDGVHAALGAYYWMNDWLRPYGEVGYIRESHNIDGPRVSAGLEANVFRYVRPFVDYSWTGESTNAGTVKYSVISLGVKIPLK